MGRKIKGLMLGVAFLAVSFGMAEQLRANTITEDIMPDVNVIRSLEEKDQINMYKTVVDETGYQNVTLNFDATHKDKVKNGWTLKVYDERNDIGVIIVFLIFLKILLTKFVLVGIF